MINALDYIQSKDIKKYLKNINYQFDIIEKAQLIYCSVCPLKDKIKFIDNLLVEYKNIDDEKYKILAWKNESLKTTDTQALSFEKEFNYVDLHVNKEYDFDVRPNLPIPFKDGDIVYDPSMKGDIYMIKKSYSNYQDNRAYDYSIYFYDEAGNIDTVDFCNDYNEFTNGWTNLEYYKGDNDKINKLRNDIKEKN